MDGFLVQCIKGYGRIVAKKKEMDIMDVREGKTFFSFRTYCAICTRMITLWELESRRHYQESIFGWTYITLVWNIMCRNNNVGKLMLSHFDWSEDAMIITLCRTKCDQSGVNEGNSKYLYANPTNPSVCPLLALGVYMICKPRDPTNFRIKLFEGDLADKRFENILNRVVSEMPQETLGGSKEEFGTHSNRKGSVTYALNFNFVSAVQVYLRAGWKIGGAADRYIFGGAGGDQIVGRTICGLPTNSPEFATLPPHFSNEDLILLEQIGWSKIVPCYDLFPQGFKKVVPYLLASVIFHIEFLHSKLPPEHPLWLQPWFTREFGGKTLPQYFGGKVLTGCGMCREANMQATGIPSHILLSTETQDLRNEINKLKELLKEMYENIPDSVADRIVKHIEGQGFHPLTHTDVQKIVNEALMHQMDEIKCLLRQSGAVNNHNTCIDPRSDGNSIEFEGYHVYCWKGAMGRYVPPNFVFPSCDCKTMWMLWNVGNASVGNGVKPYRKIYEDKRGCDLNSVQEREKLSKAARVMRRIEDIALSQKLITKEQYANNSVCKLSIEQINEIFDKTYSSLMEETNTEEQSYSTRNVDRQYTTIFNKLSRKRQRI